MKSKVYKLYLAEEQCLQFYLVEEHVELLLPVRTAQQVLPLGVSEQLGDGPHELALVKPDVGGGPRLSPRKVVHQFLQVLYRHVLRQLDVVFCVVAVGGELVF